MSDAYIGIDPGQSGAIAVIDGTCEIIHLSDWPGDEVEAAKLIREITKEISHCDIKAVIEKATAMPKQGVSSTFKFGTNYGIWKGILASFQNTFYRSYT